MTQCCHVHNQSMLLTPWMIKLWPSLQLCDAAVVPWSLNFKLDRTSDYCFHQPSDMIIWVLQSKHSGQLIHTSTTCNYKTDLSFIFTKQPHLASRLSRTDAAVVEMMLNWNDSQIFPLLIRLEFFYSKILCHNLIELMLCGWE